MKILGRTMKYTFFILLLCFELLGQSGQLEHFVVYNNKMNAKKPNNYIINNGTISRLDANNKLSRVAYFKDGAGNAVRLPLKEEKIDGDSIYYESNIDLLIIEGVLKNENLHNGKDTLDIRLLNSRDGYAFLICNGKQSGVNLIGLYNDKGKKFIRRVQLFNFVKDNVVSLKEIYNYSTSILKLIGNIGCSSIKKCAQLNESVLVHLSDGQLVILDKVNFDPRFKYIRNTLTKRVELQPFYQSVLRKEINAVQLQYACSDISNPYFHAVENEDEGIRFWWVMKDGKEHRLKYTYEETHKHNHWVLGQLAQSFDYYPDLFRIFHYANKNYYYAVLLKSDTTKHIELTLFDTITKQVIHKANHWFPFKNLSRENKKIIFNYYVSEIFRKNLVPQLEIKKKYDKMLLVSNAKKENFILGDFNKFIRVNHGVDNVDIHHSRIYNFLNDDRVRERDSIRLYSKTNDVVFHVKDTIYKDSQIWVSDFSNNSSVDLTKFMIDHIDYNQTYTTTLKLTSWSNKQLVGLTPNGSDTTTLFFQEYDSINKYRFVGLDNSLPLSFFKSVLPSLDSRAIHKVYDCNTQYIYIGIEEDLLVLDTLNTVKKKGNLLPNVFQEGKDISEQKMIGQYLDNRLLSEFQTYDCEFESFKNFSSSFLTESVHGILFHENTKSHFLDLGKTAYDTIEIKGLSKVNEMYSFADTLRASVIDQSKYAADLIIKEHIIHNEKDTMGLSVDYYNTIAQNIIIWNKNGYTKTTIDSTSLKAILKDTSFLGQKFAFQHLLNPENELIKWTDNGGYFLQGDSILFHIKGAEGKVFQHKLVKSFKMFSDLKGDDFSELRGIEFFDLVCLYLEVGYYLKEFDSIDFNESCTNLQNVNHLIRKIFGKSSYQFFKEKCVNCY